MNITLTLRQFADYVSTLNHLHAIVSQQTDNAIEIEIPARVAGRIINVHSERKAGVQTITFNDKSKATSDATL